MVQYCNHNGCNSRNEWVLHISGSASCYALNESVDGAFSAGRRSADNVLRSRGIEIDSDNPCDQYFADMVPLAEPFIQRNPNPMPSRPTGAPIQDVFQRNPTTSQPRVQPAGPQPSLSPQTEAPTLSPWTPSPTMTDNTPSPTASPLSFPTSLATTSPTTAPQDLPSSRPVPQRPSTEQTSTDQNSSPELSRKRNSPSTPWLILWIAFGFIMTLVLVLLAWLMKIGYGRFCSSRRPQGVVKATTGRHEMRSTNFATEAGSTSSTGSPHFNRSLSFNRDQSNKWINL